MFSRRQFGLALAAPLALRAQPKALQARIKIDSDRRIGAIDPKSTVISPSTWAGASKAVCLKKAPGFPTRTAIAKT